MEIEGVNIEWIGHATFRISYKDLTIYIDPYIMEEQPKRADLILITHDHFDHCDERVISMIKRDDTHLVASEACKGKVDGIFVRPGGVVEWKGIGIEAVPAYNINKPYHPREKNYVGYLIRLGRVTIYHAGDTDHIPEMSSLRGKVTVALLPIGGTYTMDPIEAAEAAHTIQPTIAIPMHYAYLPGLIRDPAPFMERVSFARQLEPLVPPPEHPQ